MPTLTATEVKRLKDVRAKLRRVLQELTILRNGGSAVAEKELADLAEEFLPTLIETAVDLAVILAELDTKARA